MIKQSDHEVGIEAVRLSCVKRAQRLMEEYAKLLSDDLVSKTIADGYHGDALLEMFTDLFHLLAYERGEDVDGQLVFGEAAGVEAEMTETLWAAAIEFRVETGETEQ